MENLPTRLRVAATHAATGAPVLLSRGPLAAALRASMAVPILFPGVDIDGRRLVDGVLSDPLPISAAPDADVVITLGFEGAMPRRVDRLSRLVAQTSTTLINNLQARVAAARATGQRLVHIELVARAARRLVGYPGHALPVRGGRRAAESTSRTSWRCSRAHAATTAATRAPAQVPQAFTALKAATI